MSQQFLTIDTGLGRPVIRESEIYTLVPENSPCLRTPAKPFDFEVFARDRLAHTAPENPIYLANSLFETMFHLGGIGLAAPQCGIPYAVFVMGAEQANKQAMFNPVIVQESKETETGPEGCLSFPHLFVRVPRAKAIVVAWQAPDGSRQEGSFTGMTARIIQHEIAHLRGQPFWHGCGETSLVLARQARAKFRKKESRK